MKIKNHIRKIFMISLWLVIGVGVMALLIAAIKIKREKICNGLEIKINGSDEGKWFVDKKHVTLLLTRNGNEEINGKSTSLFDLGKMESLLEKNVWIKDAELFFSNNQVLQVRIREREPIARIITVAEASFYIDSSCARLPLSPKMSARVPVFTGFPSARTILKPADRKLLKEIKQVSEFILKDPFWMAQVSQVDITPKRSFEIIPTIGNHVIDFGDGSQCSEKFKRLFIFYKQVLSKAGMEKYARINVQYEKQVIGIRNNYLSKIDSLKYEKNVEYLIASSRKVDSVSR